MIGLLVALAAPLAAAADRAFLTAIDDLPLAPGLIENPSAGVMFDTPQGRIVEAIADGATTAEAVSAFYIETLPELGWTQRTASAFAREDELLRLDMQPGGRGLVVRFMLQPEQ